jgi:uncharacterized protein (TIGR02145 family)
VKVTVSGVVDSIESTLDTTASGKWTRLNASTVFLKASGTLYVRARVGSATSPIASATVQMVLAAPGISLATSTYATAQSVSLTSSANGAGIHYTMDGSIPTAQSPLYSGAITVGSTQTLRAIAVKNGFQNSAVSSAAYAIADTNTYGIPWNPSITYGTLTDVRDSQIYRTVKIGAQTWMAQNLNYRGKPDGADTLGACPTGIADSCKKYGRLYTWTIAMAGTSGSNSVPSGVTGICPNGAHIPSDTEWSILISIVDSAGIRLKAVRGWNSGVGTDSYGFRALPAGTGDLASIGSSDKWWTATEYAVGGAWSREASLGRGQEWISHNIYNETVSESIRCVQNAP